MYTPHTGANHVHYAHIPLADSVLKFGVAHAGSSPWTKFFFVQSKEYLRNKAKNELIKTLFGPQIIHCS